MSTKTNIEWTRGDDGTPGATWNPLVGCSRTSPGCDACYAIRDSIRPMAAGIPAYQGVLTDDHRDWSGVVNLAPHKLDEPLRWTKPKRIFANSMSDLFHPNVPVEYIAKVFAVMGLAEWHTFQVLTKRSKRASELLNSDEFLSLWFQERNDRASQRDVQRLADRGVISLAAKWPIPNVWLGVSIENDQYAFRANHLRETPAAVRWLSCEPLLGPLPSLDLTGIDWLVAGGESGPHARPMNPRWARELRDRCADHRVPFFFKQWGEWAPADPQNMGNTPAHKLCSIDDQGTTTPAVLGPTNEVMVRLGKKSAGDRLDRIVHHAYPSTPEKSIA